MSKGSAKNIMKIIMEIEQTLSVSLESRFCRKEFDQLKVLIACEESQVVCKAFRERGHEAYSNDIVRCSGGVPKWHIMMDARAVLNGGVMRLQNGQKIEIDKWDLIIAHQDAKKTI